MLSAGERGEVARLCILSLRLLGNYQRVFTKVKSQDLTPLTLQLSIVYLELKYCVPGII